MNMPFPSREQVETIRKNYPPGTRVMLNNMNDPYSPAMQKACSSNAAGFCHFLYAVILLQLEGKPIC